MLEQFGEVGGDVTEQFSSGEDFQKTKNVIIFLALSLKI